MGDEFFNKPLPSYGNSPQYQIPVPEDHHWKREYTLIDIENKSFNYLRRKFEDLDIPLEKIEDLVEELMIVLNNAGKLKIEQNMICYLMEGFEKVWSTFEIHVLKNSRWIDEMSHIREFCLYVLEMELYKSIGGWQGDNILTFRGEQKQSYYLKQEAASSDVRRGWFRNKKPKSVSPAVQGFNISGDQGRR